MPKRLKDKLLSYLLVLALMIDEYYIDCSLLMKDLKMPLQRYDHECLKPSKYHICVPSIPSSFPSQQREFVGISLHHGNATL